jgi:nucleoside-diphosphate-sugar epimerase
MNILVTGATGFLGGRLCRGLLAKGHHVFGLTHHGRAARITSIVNNPHFKLITCDIRDTSPISEIIKANHIETVLHLAAQLPEKNDNTGNYDFYDINVTGTANLLQSAAAHNVKTFIYGSTMSVYSSPPVSLPVDENHPTQPSSIYAVTKLTGELLCNIYAGDMNIAILRYAGAYGLGERITDAVHRFMQQARANQPLTIYGDGRQSTDYVYVEDITAATLAVLEKGKTGVYNIGSGVETSILTLAEQAIKVTGSRSKITFTDTTTDRPFRFYLDTAKAQKELGCHARPLNAGLQEYLRELASQE